MILFVSDTHFGRGSPATERAKETALLDCLAAHADAVEHLYLLGDVFDSYIEYRHLVPKGAARFQGLLARWTDQGVPVTYLPGNHDPWHRDYFAEELGVRLAPGPLDATHQGVQVHLAHGDAQASAHRAYRWLRPLLRHPATAALYRSVLPADWGLGLARWVSRRLHDAAPDPDVVEALRRHARTYLHQNGTHAVVMGHSHVPALHTWPAGTYLNTGNWYERRTFGRLDRGRIILQRWNGTRALDIEAANVR